MNKEMKTRFYRVLEEIAITSQSAGRGQEQIDLVVVTKGHSEDEIEQLYQLGARLIGENRPAEAIDKQTKLTQLTELNWHMIGHVQSRKAVDVAGKFSLVHSLDSVKLARRLDRFAGKAGLNQEVLLQFNTSGEASKFGFNAREGNLQPDIFKAIDQILACTSLEVKGLMTMAPFNPDPEDARPTFSALRKMREMLSRRYPQADWSQLSMGMSGDYKVAIQEGATLLRIGTAVMGQIRI